LPESIRCVAVDTGIFVNGILVYELNVKCLGVRVVGNVNDIAAGGHSDDFDWHPSIIIVNVMPSPVDLSTLPQTVLNRPLIRLYEISMLLDTETLTPHALRKVCESADPPIPITTGIVGHLRYDDLLTPAHTHRLLKIVITKHNDRLADRDSRPRALDKVSLLLWMCGLSNVPTLHKPPPYSRLIEREISRIARLKEPARTLRIIDLMARWTDAATIARNWPWNHPDQMEKIQERLDRLCGIEVEDDE
jgi:hypothetical protein